MPKVSIITPTYNCATFLPEAIDSVIAQTYQDYELLLIDDGSKDHTAKLATDYQRRFPTKIRYIYQDNQGLANARNTAIRAATGEFFALLDADDVWLPKRLEEEVRVMESDPQIGLVHANINWIAEDGTLIGIAERDQRYLSGPMFENIFLRRADIACPTVLFRKAACDRVGLFDPNLARLGCEDRELWLRIAQEFKVVYLNQVLANYRQRMTSMSRNREKMLAARRYVVNKMCVPGGPYANLKGQALGKIHRDLGDESLLAGHYSQARREYLESIRFNCFTPWTWINLFKTCFKNDQQLESQRAV